jgi:hypothetical protein
VNLPLSKTATNLLHALVAVLVGNALYFLVLRYLPPMARHVPFRMDPGLAVDFWFCLVVLGLIKMIARRKDDAKPHKLK